MKVRDIARDAVRGDPRKLVAAEAYADGYATGIETALDMITGVSQIEVSLPYTGPVPTELFDWITQVRGNLAGLR